MTSSNAIAATAPLHLPTPLHFRHFVPTLPIIFQGSAPSCISLRTSHSSLHSLSPLLSPHLLSPHPTFNVAKVSIALILMLSPVDHAGKGFISQNTSQIGTKIDLSARQSMALPKTVLPAAHLMRSGLPALYASRWEITATIVSTSTKAHAPIFKSVQVLLLRYAIF